MRPEVYCQNLQRTLSYCDSTLQKRFNFSEISLLCQSSIPAQTSKTSIGFWILSKQFQLSLVHLIWTSSLQTGSLLFEVFCSLLGFLLHSDCFSDLLLELIRFPFQILIKPTKIKLWITIASLCYGSNERPSYLVSTGQICLLELCTLWKMPQLPRVH